MGLDPILPCRNYFSRPRVNHARSRDIFAQNDNSESEDDISSYDSTLSSNNSEENGYYTSSHMLFAPSLEDLRNVLYVALNPYFEEFEIAVVSCPCLTRAPYNLAAAGLSGNTGILRIGAFDNFYSRPRTYKVYNIRAMLSRCKDDVFVIGSGFATEPSMLYNGHLTMNAVVSAKPTNVINYSCIAYEIAPTRQIRLEVINAHNQIKCCLFGHFFVSEGKRGPVIRIRAKGRRSRSSIIALIQSAMADWSQYYSLIGLGIVLVLNGGQTQQYHLPNNFVELVYNDIMDYCGKLRANRSNCINLIALGAVISEDLLAFLNQNNRVIFISDISMFNTFFNKSSGNFYNDLTPEETEYIVYINTAQEKSVSI